jgi:manganese efflux pump family protein
MLIGWISILGIAVALAMDAFAVAIAAGLALDLLTKRGVFRLSFHFGLFQAVMPMIGWLAGNALNRYVAAFDHWIAFGLLSFVGVHMIRGAMRDEVKKDFLRDPTKGWGLVFLSVATSVDALGVGLSLGMLGYTILFPALIIGVVAAAFTIVGMLLGRRIGVLWGKRVEVIGGVILIAIGINIVVSHLTAG